jgi:hypothetical protein
MKHRSLRHRRSSGLAGGAGAPNPSSYSSAASYQMAVNGTGNDQYNRVFSMSGPDASSQSNAIIGLQGQRAGRRSRRSKNGGLWGEVINQAVVPLSLLAMQQRYGKKRGGTRKCVCNNNNNGGSRRRRGSRRRGSRRRRRNN